MYSFRLRPECVLDLAHGMRGQDVEGEEKELATHQEERAPDSEDNANVG